MDLQHIDIGPEPFYAGLDSIKDVLPRKPDPVYKRAIVGRDGCDGRLRACRVNAKVTLGENDDVGAGDFKRSQGLANDFFRATIGVNISLWEKEEAALVEVMRHHHHHHHHHHLESLPYPKY
jgi:hypothetical protein